MAFVTSIKVLEDRPDRLVVQESRKPWTWGGPAFGLEMLMIPVFVPFTSLFGRKTFTVDTVHQHITLKKRLLFASSERIDFMQVQKISVMHRNITRSSSGKLFTGVLLTLARLSIHLSGDRTETLLTSYWDNTDIREIAEKIAAMMGTPMEEEVRGKDGQAVLAQREK